MNGNGCNLEWQPTIRDYQWGPGLDTAGPVDLLALESAKTDMYATPLESPPLDFDVRAVYDSRPINAYDFNFVTNSIFAAGDTLWLTGWEVPLGYRAVVREFEVQYDQDTGGPFGNSIVWPLQGLYPSTIEPMPTGLGPAVPQVPAAVGGASGTTPVGFPVLNNGKAIGSGGIIKTFFIVEEGCWFGIQGINNNLVTQGSVTINAYGQFIPIRNEQLPYVVGNQKS